jgi:hypothetical protein
LIENHVDGETCVAFVGVVDSQQLSSTTFQYKAS